MQKGSIEIQGNDAKPIVMRSPYLDDVFPSIQNEIINQMVSKIYKQKEDLIKSKLIEKGFEHLIEGIEKRRFPKILCEKKKGGLFILLTMIQKRVFLLLQFKICNSLHLLNLIENVKSIQVLNIQMTTIYLRVSKGDTQRSAVLRRQDFKARLLGKLY